MKTKIAQIEISAAAKNGNLFIDRTSGKTIFASQQQLLEISLHAADLSVPTRNFKTVKTWTYLLFEEFFIQGDLEKEKNLPVSFLCDRETTNVAKNQPGFSNFIVIPLFTHLTELMPNLKPMLTQCKANTELWTHYSESEEDK